MARVARSTTDLYYGRADREEQISTIRSAQQEARQSGDTELERLSTARLDKALDSYAQEERLRSGH